MIDRALVERVSDDIAKTEGPIQKGGAKYYGYVLIERKDAHALLALGRRVLEPTDGDVERLEIVICENLDLDDFGEVMVTPATVRAALAALAGGG